MLAVPDFHAYKTPPPTEPTKNLRGSFRIHEGFISFSITLFRKSPLYAARLLNTINGCFNSLVRDLCGQSAVGAQDKSGGTKLSNNLLGCGSDFLKTSLH